ncbi:uncharacterized protein B0T15DRAFT_285059 [Chaetomium strumarium]|uniref:Gfo/Idh/MocA-like oxidoreductase N-terminal domain-containing protein n=1 Tax=Chaetomium strumarium TaxID=1170767 RepID=A0AAJ0GQ25_9PEZI|nr:hypothetical protein B0T15DRAFT_285059 [Chaetomium strumarium]
MAPIRVALIGLSSPSSPQATTGWAASAHLPYLLSPRGRARYQIVGLLNSSVAAAEAAIKAYNLDADPNLNHHGVVRAYASPADLAADPEVDLVVCATRVDKHYATVIESLREGKDGFVEWPLAGDPERGRELAEEVRKHGGRSKGVVGLQGLKAPVVAVVRRLLAEGRIGRVVSSELRAFGGLGDRESLPVGWEYMTQREVGGNMVTIAFAHLFDMALSALGELKPGSLKGDLHLQRPENPLKDPTGAVVRTVRSDVPDLVFVAGKWQESDITQENATLHLRLRRGQPFPGDPCVVWTINGEKGEIRIVSQDMAFIQLGPPGESHVIEVHDFETDKVEKVEAAWADWQKELPFLARGVGALYEAIADARNKGTREDYVNFDTAVKRLETVHGLLEEWVHAQ